MHSHNKIISVVAGALMRADGSFMLGSRPAGKPYAGYWEFPGGKVEPGETLFAALVREFAEEMAVTVRVATPWLTCTHHYEHASVRLNFFRIWAWDGEPQACEGQAFAWQQPGAATVAPMLPANAPILRGLSLPERLLALAQPPEADATPAARSGRFWPAGNGLCALQLHLAGGIAQGLVVDAATFAVLDARPAADWVGAEVNSAPALARAATLGYDFAVLDASDWTQFDACLADGLPLPVFARGADALETARVHGAYGVVGGV